MKKKGLGKELDAIFENTTLDLDDIVTNGTKDNGSKPSTLRQNPSQNDFEYVPMRRIEPNREQPRTLFEQEKIDTLTESIREHGVLSPLLVRTLDNGYYKIIAGERRWRAARAAELTEVPVRIISADDKNALELALVENLQREDLNPIEEARGFKALLNDFEMTQEDVATRVGRSRPAITNALRLLTLPDELIELVSTGKLPAGSARALMGIKDKNKDILLETAKVAIEREMSVREVERLVKSYNTKATLEAKREANQESSEEKNGDKKFLIDVDYTLEAQKRLTKALGRRAAIKHGQNKSVIEIEFHGKDDFNALFDALIAFGVSKLGGSDND